MKSKLLKASKNFGGFFWKKDVGVLLENADIPFLFHENIAQG